ncbi:hypothetical protein COCMIDRAFT_80648 [Bipolaris oryzae ATCC 44560]|uniref:BAH domain-containing protein n=1 Tax=Bipolaris oryzae ATCC 44560 TaxID=930090 RepID=W6ZLV7_COCMI|nr:uncharacterized protein COCMIDRAFT_80648 [Bipolaris oryzae ATCC 44560]EUC50953.1 hypothetical protein COCMIDRAFT_80648 [Bipolaris oryzae ATCC 44560]
MARKRKAIHSNAAHSHGEKAPVSKKQKVDWSAIDDFKGFTIMAANTKPHNKSLVTKNNKTGAEVKTPKYPGQDAPLNANVVQQNPFPEVKLSTVHVKISPALHWESTTRYRKFTINSEEFQVNQLVFVKSSEDSEGTNPPNAVEGWLAKILEIRAGDSSHVFLRVFWAYRPEDLPGGRQPHHGASEIVVSNHMDIIEPLTVQSLAEVVHWDDDPDSLPLPADQLFFRQSYDVTKKSNPLSALSKYCIDKQPINPDELLVQCPHCSDWLHAHCLEQQAIRDTREKHKKKGRPSKRAKANSDDLATKPSFDAKLSAADTGKTRLTITENPTSEDNAREWDVDISCLVCGKVIETAEDASKPADSSASPAVVEDTESENVTVATTTTKDNPQLDTVKSDPDAATTDSAKANGETVKSSSPV